MPLVFKSIINKTCSFLALFFVIIMFRFKPVNTVYFHLINKL